MLAKAGAARPRLATRAMARGRGASFFSMIVSSVVCVCWGVVRRTARRCHDALQNTGKLKYSEGLSEKMFITLKN